MIGFTRTGRRRHRAAIAAALGMILIVGCGFAIPEATVAATPPDVAPSPGAALSVVRLVLQWQPQSQFAGYYLARDKGLYRAVGLDLRLLHANPLHSSLDMLRAGAADVATLFLTDALIATSPRFADRSVEAAIVQVAQLVQRSNLMLLAWKDMGVTQAKGLDGQRISYWPGGFSTSFQAFFAASGIRPEVVPQYYSVNLFLRRGVVGCAAMEYNEYHRIWQSGVDSERITAFRMRDYGLGFAEDGLYATAPWVRDHPAVARAVRRASLAGWAYAHAHPQEAIDAVLAEARQAGVSTNLPHERWMLRHILDSIFVSGTPPAAFGSLDRNEFASAVLARWAAGLLDQAPEFAVFAPFEGESVQ